MLKKGNTKNWKYTWNSSLNCTNSGQIDDKAGNGSIPSPPALESNNFLLLYSLNAVTNKTDAFSLFFLLLIVLPCFLTVIFWILHRGISKALRNSVQLSTRAGTETVRGHKYSQAHECHCERQSEPQWWKVLGSWGPPAIVQEELEYRDSCEKSK